MPKCPNLRGRMGMGPISSLCLSSQVESSSTPAGSSQPRCEATDWLGRMGDFPSGDLEGCHGKWSIYTWYANDLPSKSWWFHIICFNKLHWITKYPKSVVHHIMETLINKGIWWFQLLRQTQNTWHMAHGCMHPNALSRLLQCHLPKRVCGEQSLSNSAHLAGLSKCPSVPQSLLEGYRSIDWAWMY